MTDHNYCVILAGGVGTRFWPMSRESRPKQFLKAWTLEKTLLRRTFDRMSRTIPVQNILVATLAQYKDMVIENIPELPEENIILEPYGRNTAPTIAYAALLLQEKDPDAVMVAVPADHIIGDGPVFDDNVRSALSYASEQEVLLTMGVIPTRPDTNFGYVQISGGKDAYSPGEPVKAKTFTEKPDLELAKVFVESGEFLWNSGIFFWKASVVLDEMRKCCPEITRLWDDWSITEPGPKRDTLVEKAYSETARTAIDYALMEKSDKVWVLPTTFRWSDIGSWNTLYETVSSSDEEANAVSIEGKSIIKNVSKSIVACTDPKKLLAVCGLDDFMVIDTDKVLLVCPRDDRKLQEIISELALPQYSEFK